MQAQIQFRTLMQIEKYVKKYELVRKRVLFKLGGYVQRTMQRSMRYKKAGGKPSMPNSPPKALRNNPRLRKGISFTVEERAGAVVIGPDRWDKRRKGNSSRPAKSGLTVPRLLNEGGPLEMRRLNERLEIQVIRTQMKPRPFVEPSREKGEAKFLELLAKNQIRR